MIVSLPFRSARPRVGGDQGHAVGLAAGLIISTHAPTWGATQSPCRSGTASTDFYSRPRMGGDYSNSVSILFPLNFYSRPRVGGDTLPKHHRAQVL